MLLLVLFTARVAASDYLQHAFFDNSVTPDTYYYSNAKFVAPSSVEMHAGQLPVERGIFFTPPNSLRFSWRSGTGGSWDAEIRVVDLRNRRIEFEGDTLFLWLYSPEPIAADKLPRMLLEDTLRQFSISVALGPHAGDLPAKKWTQVHIPLHDFATASIHGFDPLRTHNLYFMQGAADFTNLKFSRSVR